MNPQLLRDMITEELAKGYSRRKLSARTGVPLASINNYMDTDMQPSLRTLERFATYWRVPVTHFFDGNASPDAARQPVARPDLMKRLVAEMKECNGRLARIEKAVEEIRGKP